MEVKIKFSPESGKELEKLKEELKVVSVEDVLRDALVYLRFSREEVKSGNRICIVNQKGEIKPIRLSFLD